MIRGLAILIMVFSTSVAGAAPLKLSVSALEQMLVSRTTAHDSDSDMARKLGDVELTEQLTAAELTHLKQTLHPGPQTSFALEMLADSAAFLDPPASGLPHQAPPTVPQQQAMINGAVHFVASTFQHLPDFLADRLTTSFDNSPLVVTHSGWAPPDSPLHLAGTFTQEVTYRSGREISLREINTTGKSAKQGAVPPGLTSTGEFGPILAIVLRDISKGSIHWSRWEQTAGGTVSVFQYKVPEASSHYQVDYCCVRGSEDPKTYADRGDLLHANSYHGTPGYHGEISLDPKTGTIRRISVDAELNPEAPISVAKIYVEYGPVEIGGVSYVCPVHSLAISNARTRLGGDMSDRTILRINEVNFTHYHRFGSSMRILTDASAGAPAPSAESPASSAPEAQATAPAASTTPDAIASQASSESATTTASAATDSQSVQASTAKPIEAPQAPTPPTPSAVFKTSVREVDVDVVVRKKNGDPVTGLARQDFSVSEDGVPQSIDFFEEHSPQAPTKGTPPKMPPMPPGMRTNVPPATPGDAVNVLLLDTLNTEPQDESYVHTEIVDFLKKLEPGSEVAIFTLDTRLRFVQGFTSDPALLRAALNGKSMVGAPQRNAATRTASDRAEDAATVSNLATMQMSPAGLAAVIEAQNSVSGYQYGQRVSITFQALQELANFLAGLPGRKNLIWFASSFPVTIFPTAQQKQEMNQLPGYLNHAQQTADLLTASNVAVYPVDAKGIAMDTAGGADSSSPSGDPDSGAGRMSNPMGSYTQAAMGRAGTITSMEQIAADTGGRAYYNTNDLGAAVKKAMTDGSNYYTLAYSPKNATMSGGFRQIQVTLDKRKYKLSYRSGYNADDTLPASATATANPLGSLMQLGLPSATGLLYGVQALVTPQQPSADAPLAGQNWKLKGPVTRYTLSFLLRAQDLKLATETQGERTGKLLIEAFGYGGDGAPVNWVSETETIRLNPAEYDSVLRSGIPAHLDIDLPRGTSVRMVTGLYDLNSGLAGTMEAPLPAPAQEAKSGLH